MKLVLKNCGLKFERKNPTVYAEAGEGRTEVVVPCTVDIPANTSINIDVGPSGNTSRNVYAYPTADGTGSTYYQIMEVASAANAPAKSVTVTSPNFVVKSFYISNKSVTIKVYE